MRLREISGIAACVAIWPAAASAGTPTEAVMAFYDHVGLELDPAARGRFADPAKSVLDSNDRLKQSGEGDCLDPNMALDNVEGDISSIRSGLKTLESVKGDEAKVTVAFVAANTPHRLQWRLVKVDGEWKVADFLSVTGEWTLSEYHCE